MGTDAPPGLIVGGKVRFATALVVDDDDDAREIMREYLVPAGYQVKDARDGREALGQLLAAPPDLIVADIVMPSMTGWELLQVIRSYVRLARIPVLMVSALRDGIPVCDAFTRFLPKPIQEKIFVDTANELLSRHDRPGSG